MNNVVLFWSEEEEEEEAQESWMQEHRGVMEAVLNRSDCRDETSRFPATLRRPASLAVA